MITYNIASEEDIPALVEKRIRFATELAGQQKEETVSTLKRHLNVYFQKAMKDGSCISIIARSGDQVAGTGSVIIREQMGNFKNPSGKWGYIMNMYTLPEFRRKGICTGILNALTGEARKMGIPAFELHATHDGEFVYRQNGFTIHKEPAYRKYITE